MSSSTAPMGPVPSLVTRALIIVSVVFPVLSIISLYLRYTARRVGRLALQADDWWIVVAWISTFGLSICTWIFGSITGVDHYKINPLEGAQKSTQLLYITGLLLDVCLATVKISILFFYKRIFTVRPFKISAWIGIAVVACWSIIFFFIGIFQVDPVEGAWTGRGRFTVDVTAYGLAQAGTSIALDFIVLCFPLPVLYTLHMRIQKKVMVGMIFWLGGFCCIAAIIRLVFLHEALAAVANSKSSAGYDSIYLEAKSFILAIIEPNCSIIAASLPCYGPLFAGGRGPESLIRSVRSMFSLRSRASQSPSGSGVQGPPKAYHHGAQVRADRGATESQLELNQVSRDWSTHQSQGRNTSKVEPLAHDMADADKGYHGHGIGVTKTYEARQEFVV